MYCLKKIRQPFESLKFKNTIISYICDQIYIFKDYDYVLVVARAKIGPLFK